MKYLFFVFMFVMTAYPAVSQPYIAKDTLRADINDSYPAVKEGARQIWVSPEGTANGDGTAAKPVSDLVTARRIARELRRLKDPSITNGIHIILKGGNYYLTEPIVFRPEDSGTKQSPTIIMAAKGENPVLNGGVTISGWKRQQGAVKGLPQEATGKVWVADIPTVGGRRLELRQLWVDGVKAQRASTQGDNDLPRILSVDKQNEILWIPKPKFRTDNIKQLEFNILQWWSIAYLRVMDIKIKGDSAAVRFHQPESRVEFEHPWPRPYIDEKKDKNGNSAFYFVNAIELLNREGEWYADIDNGKIWYYPLKGQDMSKATVTAPYLESLVKLQGTVDNPVQNIHFYNTGFAYTAWKRPSEAGHVPLQAGFYLTEAYKLRIPGTPDKAHLENQGWVGRQPAAVELSYTGNTVFYRCSFSHTAATGIDYITGSYGDVVKGCLFTDIGGTAIQSGFFGNDSFEAHLPYNPEDEREVCRNQYFISNLIDDATNEDWGCVGIGVGYAHDITIAHNEICNINYSGISIGWGWTKTITCMRNNLVHANYIHHFAKNLYDVGGVYTLSAQPNTEISENRIEDLLKAPYTHDPDHYQYIYFDEGSSYIRAINNYTEADKFFSNTPGPGNEWKNNGPQVSDDIKNKAGLLPEYKSLKNK